MFATKPPVRRAIAVATALAALGLLGACGGSGSGDAATTSTTAASRSVTLIAGPVTVQRTGAVGEATPEDVQGLLRAAEAYIGTATIDPMAGRPVRLAAISTPQAVAAATAADADAFSDASIGRVDAVRVIARPSPISVLMDPNGVAVLGAVTVDLTVTGRARNGAITVHRTGELAFARDVSGWRLNSWRLTATRSGPGISTPPRPTSTTKAP